MSIFTKEQIESIFKDNWRSSIASCVTAMDEAFMLLVLEAYYNAVTAPSDDKSIKAKGQSKMHVSKEVMMSWRRASQWTHIKEHLPFKFIEERLECLGINHDHAIDSGEFDYQPDDSEIPDCLTQLMSIDDTAKWELNAQDFTLSDFAEIVETKLKQSKWAEAYVLWQVADLGLLDDYSLEGSYPFLYQIVQKDVPDDDVAKRLYKYIADFSKQDGVISENFWAFNTLDEDRRLNIISAYFSQLDWVNPFLQILDSWDTEEYLDSKTGKFVVPSQKLHGFLVALKYATNSKELDFRSQAVLSQTMGGE
jgi:hypothetical protein